MTARARAYARGITRAHTRDLALALDRALAFGLGRDVGLDIAVTRGLDFARTGALNRDHVVFLAHGLAEDLDRDHDLPRALAGILGFDRNTDLARGHARDLCRDLAPGAALRTALERECAHVSDVVTLLERAAGTPAAVVGVPAAVAAGRTGEDAVPRRVAVRVLARVARVLPPSERERYRHEFLAELHALAGEGASGQVQLSYALHAAVNALSLRRALRAPRPGRERAR